MLIGVPRNSCASIRVAPGERRSNLHCERLCLKFRVRSRRLINHPPSPRTFRMSKAAHKTERPVRSVAFVSLGCPKNLVDSERMLGLLAQDGLAITPDAGDADAIVINTCG